MNVEEFIRSFFGEVLEKTPRSISNGQALMNYLYNVKPSLYNNICDQRKTDIDCFYDERNIGSTINYIIRNWKNYE